ncbi:erythromycin esterase family protein [Nocardia sp. CNY236]|uniref:erythromycin esterase family protein n=1 Tax=Nocardia sp. CNY236 TaxID=1169152 RepID=UPI0004109D4E|nr:erythromycin esterase family protein [Nocardia sp. CNY236]
MTFDTSSHRVLRDSVWSRRLLSTAALVLVAGTLVAGIAPASAAPDRDNPVDALNHSAQPLSDLNALCSMIGSARVVGLGEASHSAHEFFALKQRIFQHLVATKGFTTFALETSWSTGLRLDNYVVNGVGDPALIMREEFVGQYVFWNTDEYLNLIHWMRDYNTVSPQRAKLRFVGNDLGYAGPQSFTRVADYLSAHRPDLADRMSALYAGIRPTAGTSAGTWMNQQLAKDLALRKADMQRADEALAILRDEGQPHDASHRSTEAYAWALQNATAIVQSFTGYAFSDEQFPERMRYRDQVMADNTAWWLEHTTGKTLLASNNGHVAYTSDDPEMFPVPTGAFLRERLGERYVNIGLTFNQGSVNALPDFTAERPKTYTVVPAPQGHNEHTLDMVRFQDYAIDLRTAPAAARAWLMTARPTRSYGLYWSPESPPTSLGRSYDILVHLHQVKAAHLR